MRRVEAQLKIKANEIELEAFGLTAAMDGVRPVMLFKEKGGEAVLPVWLSPIDAGIALSQHQPQTYMVSPHELTLSVLKDLGVTVDRCHFRELKGNQQYVEIFFSGGAKTGAKKMKSQRARADHAISFCLQARAKFYCTRDYLEQCRQVDAEITRGAKIGAKSDLKRAKHQFMN